MSWFTQQHRALGRSSQAEMQVTLFNVTPRADTFERIKLAAGGELGAPGMRPRRGTVADPTSGRPGPPPKRGSAGDGMGANATRALLLPIVPMLMRRASSENIVFDLPNSNISTNNNSTKGRYLLPSDAYCNGSHNSLTVPYMPETNFYLQQKHHSFVWIKFAYR